MTVATHVPVIIIVNMRLASIPLTRIGSDQTSAAPSVLVTVCPVDTIEMSDPTFVLLKYGADAVMVTSPLSALGTSVSGLTLLARKGPLSGV